MVIFTFLLNSLCQRGLGIISWFIIFVPFILMSVISALLLYYLGLDPKTGKLHVVEKQKELKHIAKNNETKAVDRDPQVVNKQGNISVSLHHKQ